MDELDPQTDYSTYRLLGVSLIYSYVRLDAYRQSDLPQELLDRLDAALAAVRRGGIKVILRFSYNFGPYPNSEPDAPLEQILRHIQQLKPVLQKERRCHCLASRWFHRRLGRMAFFHQWPRPQPGSQTCYPGSFWPMPCRLTGSSSCAIRLT